MWLNGQDTGPLLLVVVGSNPGAGPLFLVRVSAIIAETRPERWLWRGPAKWGSQAGRYMYGIGFLQPQEVAGCQLARPQPGPGGCSRSRVSAFYLFGGHASSRGGFGGRWGYKYPLWVLPLQTDIHLRSIQSHSRISSLLVGTPR